MKQAVLILFLCCSRLLSQVGPPDLRCIETLQNGNILLTWIPPPDPSNSFNSYQVFSAGMPGGPYNPVGIVTSIGTNTFVDVTTAGAANVLYYYVVTKSGAGGANSSTSSDTLRSINFNVASLTGAVDLKLTYNTIRDPKLVSTSPTFTVNKEYPVGTWSPFVITSDTQYADTISVCNALISYQVVLADNSGCVSKSSVITGTYTDKYRPGGPHGPTVDSISVLPDGSTVISWEVPRDLDITKYQIFLKESMNAIVVQTAQVIGRQNTSYVYTLTTANSQAMSLYVAAIDSCSNNPGIYNDSPVTMFLKPKYNYCLYETELLWNRYRGMPGGVLEYRIYYSSGGNFTQIGSTQDSTFTHKGVAPGKNICYYVRVFNNSKKISASSNRVCFFTTLVKTTNFVYIKSATVTGKTTVQLNLFLDTSATSKGLDILRSTNGSNFTTIGFAPFSQQAEFSFTDGNASTESQSYFYKAVVRDSCNNARATSNSARTILLRVQEDNGNIFSKHLSWNAYEGFSGGVSGYTIYRVINDVITNTPLGSTTPGTTYYTDDIEDAASQGAKIEYLVRAKEGSTNIYGFQETSDSNPAAVYMEGNIYIPTAFAPNGHNKTWRPVTHFIDKTDYSVSVFNRWGAKVFDTNRDDIAWDGNDCIPDVYVYLIRYKTSTGEYKEVKGTVLMLE